MKFFKKASKVLAVGVLATSVLLLPAGNNANAKNNVNEVESFSLSKENRYIITFKDNEAIKSNLNTSDSKAELISEFKYLPNTVTVKMNDKAVKALSKNPNVLSIEPDLVVEADSYYTAPFHSNAWTIDATNANTAFKNGVSGEGVKIAILDTGLDKNNPVIKHAIKGGTSVVDWTNDYQDTEGHGTAVAGNLAGKYQGKPIGVAPDVDLYGVLINTGAGEPYANVSDIIKGIEWSIANDMDAINISYSAIFGSEEIKKIAKIANINDVMIFHSAGNSHIEYSDKSILVNKCVYTGIYCVSAIDRNHKLASFSAYGDNIAFSSFGVNAPIALLGSSMPAMADGTSFSAPTVTGIFALFKSRMLPYDNQLVVSFMQLNKVKFNVGVDGKYYAGMPVYIQW